MNEAIKKALESGWKPNKWVETGKMNAVLDAGFWQCFGKSLGWGKTKSGRETFAGKNWKREWHRFVDHLASGKDPEDFFKELLTK